MALPPIKLTWGTSRIFNAKWRAGLFVFFDQNPESTHPVRSFALLISVRGLFAWIGMLALGAYFTGAGVLWLWLDSRTYNLVTYQDLVLPSHWSRIKRLQGQAYIAEGMDDLRQRKWREATMKLQIGVNRYPEGTKARIELANFYIAANQRKQAKQLLSEAFDFGFPGRAYVRHVCTLAADSEDYVWWISTCNVALAQLSYTLGQTAEYQEIMQQKLSALMAAGRTSDVLRLVDMDKGRDSAMFKEFKVLALLKEKRVPEAVAFLGNWREIAGLDPQVVRLQVRAFREIGQFDAMDRAIDQMRALDPADPRPYIYGITQRYLAGRREDADQGIDQFLMRFGGSPEAVATLVAPLAEVSELSSIDRLMDHAREQGFALEPYRLARIKILLDKADWTAALEDIDALKDSWKTTDLATTLWIELMGRLVRAVIDPSEGVQSHLIDFISKRQLSLKTDREFIGILRRAGRPATARMLIVYAQTVYPDNSTLKGWRAELDTELAAVEIAAHTKKVKMPPARVTVPVVVPQPIVVHEELSEAMFFKRLADFDKNKNFQAALRQILDLRLAKPSWFGKREDDIQYEEMRFNGRSGDLLALRLVANEYINGSRDHAARSIVLARDLYENNCKEAALLLTNELLRKIPNYPPAKRLIAEWIPSAPIKP